ncbi:cytochrome c biogenesis protein ResB [Paenibacillus senegalensis]|uniref:cytochrome c biogenesis protein ResB n=1 Tax=Paenibacillus senegalensis TaxID=1465766 RepID=UPI000474A5C5|nr:cytochrome c biogenesis protein ResB [Paenibacillus senegalensis]
MIENTKCECGHQNHLGTVLCESCGKPLYDDHGDEVLEMRYDGVARRSQKQNPSWIDKIWRFFSSVKVAVYLIIITLLGAILGSIYPQSNVFINNFDPSTYYRDNFGTLGHIYYLLGLHKTYESWWFLTLLFMIGTSLVVCSLDRVLPLYRALKKQQIRKHEKFLTRQKVTYQSEIAEIRTEDDAEAWVENMAKRLRKRFYRVHTEGSALLAEKYRFSRWGPYILHIGLIIFLMAAFMRSLPGWQMDRYMGFLEGQTVQIPDTKFFLKNEKFTVELYSPEEMSEEFRAKDRAAFKLFQTKAVLYECTEHCNDPSRRVLEEVHRHDIEVNHPLVYEGLIIYQFDFQQTPRLLSVSPSITNKQTGESYGPFYLSTYDPQTHFEVGPYSLELKGYFPDFALDSRGEPITQSADPNAPAYIFTVKGPALAPDGEIFIYFPREVDKNSFRQDDLNGELAQKIEISAGSMENVEIADFTSYLNVRVDRAMPYIWIACAISMIGLIMNFYWQHRRIWVRIDGQRLLIGAHTNKNWFGLRKEVADALEHNNIKVDPKSLNNGGNSS